MKKTLLLILTFMIVGSLLFVSCTKDEGSANENGENAADYENNGNTGSAFSEAEKDMLLAFGFDIPYIANNGYTISECTEKDEASIHLSASVESETVFDVYRSLYSTYEYHGTKVDGDGITHHTYYVDGFYIEMSYTPGENGGIVDVCASVDTHGTGKNPTENENGDCDVEFDV